MLIQFSVENFLSIKDNVVLSLLASKDNEHPEHLIVDGNKKHTVFEVCRDLRSQRFRKVQCLECVLVHGKLCADFA